MFLLTGPNMAGKSTLLRSTCAVALLAACGLAAPAAPSTTVPYIDAFMLRNFAADSPIEGRSSFAVEMTEMRYVLQDATASSLVLVDELGKGTEASAGAALAGAMLEALEAAGCKGAFATHLHALLEMDLNLPGTKTMMMEVESVENLGNGGNPDRRRKPTWRVVPGVSTESLALEVAVDCRLPADLVGRAGQLYTELLNAPKTGAKSGTGHGSGGLGVGSEEPEYGTTGEDSPDGIQGSARNGHRSSGEFFGNPGPSPELCQVGAVLERTMAQVLEGLDPGLQQEGTDFAVNGGGVAQFVPTGLLPPARTVGASCVYIARRRSDGRFYVGKLPFPLPASTTLLNTTLRYT